ncbi:hypothetical protein DZI78_26165 [Escherichia coli]|nr:hypothetical protein [Escherichia coli]
MCCSEVSISPLFRWPNSVNHFTFNWFSAAREDKYQRYDTSLVYRGEGVKNEIKAIYGSLDQRQL